MEEKETGSEFGKGFLYPLFLFAKHFDTHRSMYPAKDFENKPWLVDVYSKRFSMWFYGAGDHLFEMQIPRKFLGDALADRFEAFKDKVLELRLPMSSPEATGADWMWAFKELEELIMEVDKLLGVDVIEAQYK